MYAAGGVKPPGNALACPASAPALGLRAGDGGLSLHRRPEEYAMSWFNNWKRFLVVCGTAALLVSLSPATAPAQSVKGMGVTFYEHGAVDGATYFEQVTVNAWIDADGVAHGKVTWIGDTPIGLPGNQYFWGRGGPADPFQFDVTDITVFGNTAMVAAVLTASPDGPNPGTTYYLFFTDNSGSGQPDEFDGNSVDVGGFNVTD
jgi:hypothetical protein